MSERRGGQKNLRKGNDEHMIGYQNFRLVAGAFALGVANRSLASALKAAYRPTPTRAEGCTERILVVKLDRLGDCILASPFFRELRRNCPDAIITVFASSNNTKIFAACPYIDKVITVPGKGLALKRNAIQAAHALRRYAPSLCLVPRSGFDIYGAAEAAFLSGAPRRLGFSERDDHIKALLNWGADTLFTDVIRPDIDCHEVERNLLLVKHLGHPVMDSSLEFWPLSSESGTKGITDLRGYHAGPLVAVGPFASERKKTWPASRFVSLCRRLRQHIDARFVILGAPGDIAQIDELRTAIGGGVVLAGAYPLAVVGMVYKQCSLFIGCDSGPKHIAAAVGVPVVEISCHPASGDSGHRYSPSRFGAWGVPTVAVQPTGRKPCVGGCGARAPHCILDVSVEQVENAVTALLSQATRAKAAASGT